MLFVRNCNQTSLNSYGTYDLKLNSQFCLAKLFLEPTLTTEVTYFVWNDLYMQFNNMLLMVFWNDKVDARDSNRSLSANTKL